MLRFRTAVLCCASLLLAGTGVHASTVTTLPSPTGNWSDEVQHGIYCWKLQCEDPGTKYWQIINPGGADCTHLELQFRQIGTVNTSLQLASNSQDVKIFTDAPAGDFAQFDEHGNDNYMTNPLVGPSYYATKNFTLGFQKGGFKARYRCTTKTPPRSMYLQFDNNVLYADSTWKTYHTPYPPFNLRDLTKFKAVNDSCRVQIELTSYRTDMVGVYREDVFLNSTDYEYKELHNTDDYGPYFSQDELWTLALGPQYLSRPGASEATIEFQAFNYYQEVDKLMDLTVDWGYEAKYKMYCGTEEKLYPPTLIANNTKATVQFKDLGGTTWLKQPIRAANPACHVQVVWTSGILNDTIMALDFLDAKGDYSFEFVGESVQPCPVSVKWPFQCRNQGQVGYSEGSEGTFWFYSYGPIDNVVTLEYQMYCGPIPTWGPTSSPSGTPTRTPTSRPTASCPSLKTRSTCRAHASDCHWIKPAGANKMSCLPIRTSKPSRAPTHSPSRKPTQRPTVSCTSLKTKAACAARSPACRWAKPPGTKTMRCLRGV